LDRQVLDSEFGGHFPADGLQQLVGEGGIVTFDHDMKP
jgi:hypothetical protein